MIKRHSRIELDSMATFLITGGGGYVGFHIGLKLVQLKMKVILLDINFPSAKWGCSIVQPSTQGNGTSTAQIVCPYGSIEFVQGVYTPDLNSFLGYYKKK